MAARCGRSRRAGSALDVAEYFAPQRTPTEELPDPQPLISLDLYQQRAVSSLIDSSRRDRDRAVLMITHDVNPVLDMVDTVVYLAAGQVRTGTVDEVLTSEVLSELYQTPVDVIRARGRIVVVGLPDGAHEGHEAHPHHPGAHE